MQRTFRPAPKIFYAAAAGDIIGAHRFWRVGQDDPSQTSITFSSQIEDFIVEAGAQALMVSPGREAQCLVDGPIQLERVPKRSGLTGWRYHLEELRYGMMLVRKALRFRANFALIDSGATHLFLTWLLRLRGIGVIPILHNTLWGGENPPARGSRAIILALDRLFWRRGPAAVIAMSPKCEAQVRRLAPRLPHPIVQARAQFKPDQFAGIAPPPPADRSPFAVLFVGRIEEAKGVFDVLAMAEMLERRGSGRVKWTICGTGPDADQLQQEILTRGLKGIVDYRGWTSPADLQGVMASHHVVVVPTRSTFAEGLAMTAVEAVLSGRPVVTNSNVPALQLLGPACAIARPDDVHSHAEAIWSLANDQAAYERLRLACATQGQEFLDRRHGLAAALSQATGTGSATNADNGSPRTASWSSES